MCVYVRERLLYVCCVCVCARLHLDVVAFVCTHVRVTQLTFFFLLLAFPCLSPRLGFVLCLQGESLLSLTLPPDSNVRRAPSVETSQLSPY